MYKLKKQEYESYLDIIKENLSETLANMLLLYEDDSTLILLNDFDNLKQKYIELLSNNQFQEISSSLETSKNAISRYQIFHSSFINFIQSEGLFNPIPENEQDFLNSCK